MTDLGKLGISISFLCCFACEHRHVLKAFSCVDVVYRNVFFERAIQRLLTFIICIS